MHPERTPTFSLPRPATIFLMAVLATLCSAGSVAGMVSEDCADCHDDSPAALADSVHGFLECLDCHPGADSEDHPDAVGEPACADCHEDLVESLAGSIHGSVAAHAEFEPDGCSSCHGPAHDLKPQDDPLSPIHGSRVAETCGRCHANPELAQRIGIRLVQPLAAYSASVHAMAVGDDRGGARCSDCHGAHDILPANDPRSKVHHQRVPELCGQCHAEITEAYEASVHGRAAAHGIRESPVCTDCHGEHRVLGPDYKDSPVFASNVPKMTCGRCHGDLRLSEKFGIPPDRVPAYAESFHGLASRTGSVTVASCASCHGVHDILPSTDPESHIHPDNLATTCGHCHPGAGKRFAIGPVHVLEGNGEHTAATWIRWAYRWLILLTIGAMLLHNGLDLYRKGKISPPPSAAVEVEQRERMSQGFRWAHALLAVSFMVLAYTGFALKYPDAWWAEPLLQWEDRLGVRGGIHRLAAVVMLVATGLHAIHLIVDRRARACIAQMRPGRSDWLELKAKLGYLLGRTPAHPPAPWLGYAEKIEYLAVIWGTLVMALTGFLLWFEELTLRWLPAWTADVATVIHLYEAILAGLAILVWHFYAVIFDPVVYPMDKAWLTGRSAPGRALERSASQPQATQTGVPLPPST